MFCHSRSHRLVFDKDSNIHSASTLISWDFVRLTNSQTQRSKAPKRSVGSVGWGTRSLKSQLPLCHFKIWVFGDEQKTETFKAAWWKSGTRHSGLSKNNQTRPLRSSSLRLLSRLPLGKSDFSKIENVEIFQKSKIDFVSFLFASFQKRSFPNL